MSFKPFYSILYTFYTPFPLTLDQHHYCTIHPLSPPVPLHSTPLSPDHQFVKKLILFPETNHSFNFCLFFTFYSQKLWIKIKNSFNFLLSDKLFDKTCTQFSISLPFSTRPLNSRSPHYCTHSLISKTIRWKSRVIPSLNRRSYKPTFGSLISWRLTPCECKTHSKPFTKTPEKRIHYSNETQIEFKKHTKHMIPTPLWPPVPLTCLSNHS